jgi:DHA2 family multidrug resistance protein-like MFS transporter
MIAPVMASGLVPVAAQIVNKIRPAYVVATGFIIAAAGFVAMTQLTVHKNMVLLLAGIIGISVGTTVVLAIVVDLIVAVAPAERVSSVAGLQKVSQEFGGAVGVAIFGSIGASVYSHHIAASLTPRLATAVPPGSRQTIGAATAAAGHLPHGLADTLLGIARAAFTDALNASAVLGICVALAAAVLTFLRLRHISYADKPKPAEAVPEAELEPKAAATRT